MQHMMQRILIVLVILLSGCAQAPPTAAPTTAPAPATSLPTNLPATPLPRPSALPTATIQPTAAPSATPLPRYDLVLIGGTLIDGSGAPPQADQIIAITAGRIVAIGPHGSLPYSQDTPTRDLTGQTIMPGFINAHAHTSDLSDDQLRQWVRAGITTVRDLGGVLETVVDRRDAIRASNDPSLPRLVVAGPIMNVLGSYSTEIYGISDEIAIVSGTEDAQDEVNRILDGGADLIKLAVSGRTDVNYAELSDAELNAIIETAHGSGVHVAAHVDRASALRRAVAAGIDSAVHSPRDRIPDDLIAQMVDQQVGLIPTIAVYEGLARERGNLDDWRRSIQPVMYDNLRRFVAAGGFLAFGDDYGGAPGMTLGMPIEEINHWMAAGLSPMQIIVAATRDAAKMIGFEQELGQVKVGYQADLLIVAGDPLQEISTLNRPTLVIHAGQIIQS